MKFFEIFENKFYDLFSKAKTGKCDETTFFCHIKGLDLAEASTLWSKALVNRKMCKTKNNDFSSRSHAVFVLVFVSE